MTIGKKSKLEPKTTRADIPRATNRVYAVENKKRSIKYLERHLKDTSEEYFFFDDPDWLNSMTTKRPQHSVKKSRSTQSQKLRLGASSWVVLN